MDTVSDCQYKYSLRIRFLLLTNLHQIVDQIYRNQIHLTTAGPHCNKPSIFKCSHRWITLITECIRINQKFHSKSCSISVKFLSIHSIITTILLMTNSNNYKLFVFENSNLRVSLVTVGITIDSKLRSNHLMICSKPLSIYFITIIPCNYKTIIWEYSQRWPIDFALTTVNCKLRPLFLSIRLIYLSIYSITLMSTIPNDNISIVFKSSTNWLSLIVCCV